LHAGGAGPTWVHVAGGLDVSSAPRLAQALDHTDWAGLVILDLRDLSFLDASAVRVIVKASRHARRTRGRLMLIGPPSRFDRVLALADGASALEILNLDSP
jgi:anti-anti-sigma factor